MFLALMTSVLAIAPIPRTADPDPAIRVTLSSEGRYLPGDRARVQVRTRDDGYVLVLQVDPEQRVRVLFPLDPTDDNYVRGGKNYTILGRGGREGFVADAGGSGTVFAAISQDPWRFTAVTVNDHWDYRALNASAYDDPEPQLVDLAQRLAGGRFDYDILPYSVLGSISEGSTGTVVADDYYSAAPTAAVAVGSCFNCGGWSISVGFGTGYYGGAYWGLYDPWYYDPWYYRPAWYGPWYPAYSPWWGATYPPYWGPAYPGYGYGYGPGYGAAYGSPYQFKAANRRWSGNGTPYRETWSRGTLAATNTVSGQVPSNGVWQRAGFRDRTWDGSGANPGGASSRSANVPVSKTGATSGRRVAPKTDGGRNTSGGVSAPRRTAPETRVSVPVSRSEQPAERPEARPVRRPDSSADAKPAQRQVPVSKADQGDRPVPVSKSDGKAGEPGLFRRSEPQRTEPKRTEPQRTEPQRTEPRRAEPQRSEPQRTESRRSESQRSGGTMSAPPQGRSGGGSFQGGGGNRGGGGMQFGGGGRRR